MNIRPISRRSAFFAALLASMALLAMTAATASASVQWRIDTIANTTAAPGETLRYIVMVRNVGDTTTEGAAAPIVFSGDLPPGMTPTFVISPNFGSFNCAQTFSDFTCEDTSSPLEPKLLVNFWVDVEIGAGVEPGSVLTPSFEIHGGGSSDPSASTVDPTAIALSPRGFGIDAFDSEVTADQTGSPLTRAAAHPYDFTTSLDFNTATNPVPLKGLAWPREPVREVEVEMPPGFVGNPTVADRCTAIELVGEQDTSDVKPDCSPESQVGVTFVHLNALTFFHPFLGGVSTGSGFGPLPVFRMVSPSGVPARFGFNVAGTIVLLDVEVRSEGDYGLTAHSRNIPEGLPVAGSIFTFWGIPSSHAHDPERGCRGENQPWLPNENGCESEAPERPFFRNPTSCTAPGQGLLTTVRAASWVNPGVFDETSFHSHLPKGYPYPPSEWGPEAGIDSCDAVPFHPSLEAAPTTHVADSPSGLDLHLTIPQDCWEHFEETCPSDLKNAEVTLPQGMSLNPSSAAGLGACSAAQVGLITPVGQSSPIHFDKTKASCPNDSKLGNVSIETPLLEEPLEGSVYLAKQSKNPFGSLMAMYLVAEGSGVVVKQAGEIVTEPKTGRLTTVFREAPQTPFSDLHVTLFGGPRAPLRTPPSCGTFAVTAKLTPWSGTGTVSRAGGFEIDQCPSSGFDPKLSGGTENPLAATTSPFNLRITRADGSPELGGLTVTLPPGLSGYLKGIPYCPDAALVAVSDVPGTGVGQEAQSSCSAASQLGRVTVGAGAGPEPFFTRSGRAYLAGPYKGAPLSIAVIAPAVAGPFDLGSVVVRNAIRVDPVSAQITTVSDPLPTILHGVPLDLRDIRVELNRDRFTLNPTNCEEMRIGSAISSVGGAVATPSERFQVAGCDKLAFRPKLSLRLSGKTRRAGNPGVRATLTVPQKGPNANISSVQVSLPRSEFVAQAHLADVCTRVQYAEGGGGGGGCPAKSVYGHARAWSPLLDQPLEGKIYLRSNGGERQLPDLVASLNGQIHVDLVGYIGSDERTGGLETTFATAPDAPVEKVVVTLPAGKHSLLENSTDICRGTRRAIVRMTAHNDAVRELRPKLKVAGCGKSGGHGRKGRHAHR